MTLQNLSESLESILRYDKSRLNTVGRLLQNSVIYIVLVFLFGTLIEDIFPNFQEKDKPSSLIILEIFGQLLLISFIIFYLQKIVDRIPYIGMSDFDNDDVSLPYCEQFLIFVVLISTQSNLIKKIKYIYNLFGNPRSQKEVQISSERENDNNKIVNILSKTNDNEDKSNIETSNLQEHLKDRDPSTLNQRINTYNQDEQLKYVPKDSYSKPMKPLLTSNDFLKDSMIMEYTNLVKNSNDKIDSKYYESKKGPQLPPNQVDNFGTFSNPSLSDNSSFGTQISQIPDFNKLGH